MVKMLAVIDWLSQDQGGRSQPPTGVGASPYAPVVRFTDPEEPWPPPVAWSLVVEKSGTSGEPLRWLADVHFLVDEAPHESLRPGRGFDLYEGSKRVAHGKVLGDAFPTKGAMAVPASSPKTH